MKNYLSTKKERGILVYVEIQSSFYAIMQFFDIFHFQSIRNLQDRISVASDVTVTPFFADLFVSKPCQKIRNSEPSDVG
jgi:hypothetical protein